MDAMDETEQTLERLWLGADEQGVRDERLERLSDLSI